MAIPERASGSLPWGSFFGLGIANPQLLNWDQVLGNVTGILAGRERESHAQGKRRDGSEWCEGRWQWWLLLAAQSVSKPKPELGGGVGADTPLCPSTHRKAKRKFSPLEGCQEWG